MTKSKGLRAEEMSNIRKAAAAMVADIEASFNITIPDPLIPDPIRGELTPDRFLTELGKAAVDVVFGHDQEIIAEQQRQQAVDEIKRQIDIRKRTKETSDPSELYDLAIEAGQLRGPAKPKEKPRETRPIQEISDPDQLWDLVQEEGGFPGPGRRE